MKERKEKRTQNLTAEKKKKKRKQILRETAMQARKVKGMRLAELSR